MKFMRDDDDFALLEQPVIRLTTRQMQVLDLVVKGYTNQQIADALGMRFYTVSTHLKVIYKKLGVRKRVAAVARMMAVYVSANGNAPQTRMLNDLICRK